MNVGLRVLGSRPNAVMNVFAPIQFVVLAVMSVHCSGLARALREPWPSCRVERPCMGALDCSPLLLCVSSCACRSPPSVAPLGAVCKYLAIVLNRSFLAPCVLVGAWAAPLCICIAVRDLH